MPGECTLTSYQLEYGCAEVELQKNAFEFAKNGTDDGEKVRVLVVDDLLATGGTLAAGCELVNKTPMAVVSHAFVVMELDALKGREKLPGEVKLTSFLKF